MHRPTQTIVWLLTGLLPGCATLGRPATPEPFRTFEGREFRVLCHFDCGEAGEAALDAAEAAWRRTASLVGGTSDNPPRPIHLYETEEEYEAVEARLTGGRFRENRAFTLNGVESHLAVHPNLSLEALDEFGLTSNTLRVVAHEATHVALRALAPRSSSLPEWLDEGLATSIELDALVDLGLAPSRADEPVSGTRMYLMQDRVRRDRLPPLSELLAGETEDLTLSERYAFYQLFTDFLRTPPYVQRFSAALRSLDRIDSRRFDRALVPAILGREIDAVAPVDSAFRAWIETLEPGWVQARRALMAAGRDWLQVGFDNGAEAWRWPRTRLPYALTGRVRTLGAQASPTLLIALPDGARIAFVIEEATVRVERHAVIGDPRPVVLTETPTGPVRSEIAFSLRVDAKGITARIGDATMGVAAEPSGRWGLAVGPAGNAVWSDVTVEPVR